MSVHRLAAPAATLLAVLLLAAPLRAQLDAEFSATPTSGTNTLEVAFTDLSTGGPISSWVWDFGDGGKAVGPDPVHTYVTPGTYTVSLTIFTLPFSTSTETKVDLITVDPAPLVVDFTATPEQGDNPLQVQFEDASTGGAVDSWTWDFGDGSGGVGPSPSHTYTTPGTYSVSLTVTVGTQVESLTQVGLITVDPAPLAPRFVATPDAGFNPLEVAFTDASTGATPTGWSWDFGDGGTSDEQNPVHRYTQPGSFDVTLTLELFGQSATRTEFGFVNVAPAPLVVDFVGAPTAGELPLTVQFESLLTGAEVTGVVWDFGDGTTSTELNPSHTYIPGATTDFTVSLTAFVEQQREGLVRPDYVSVDVPFVQHDITAPGTRADAVITADVDGDGNPDVIGARTQADEVLWFENTDGRGGFGPGQLVAAIESPFDVRAADVDGDDDPDVIVASAFGGTLTWHENADGAGGFGPAQPIDDGLGLPQSVAAGDLDGDGDVDVACAAELDDTVGWYANADGAGTFGPQQVLDDDANGARFVTLADLDGDDDLDVLYSTVVDQTIAWFDNTDGQGTFAAAPALPTTSIQPYALRTVDLDADGDLDVLAAFGVTDVSWFANDGAGTFGAPQVVTAELGIGRDLAAADLDGDGDVDVATGGTLSGLRWQANADGVGGAFAAPRFVSGLPRFFTALAQRDLDGDGDVDLLAASNDGQGHLAWFANPLASPTWPYLGQGLAGAAGQPVLAGAGDPSPGQVVTLSLSQGAPSGTSALFVGFSLLQAPFLGGVLVPSPDVAISGLLLDAEGALQFSLRWPDGLAPETTAWFQHWILDAGAPQGFAASNAVSVTGR